MQILSVIAIVYLWGGLHECVCVCAHACVCLSVCAGGEVPCEAQIDLELNPSFCTLRVLRFHHA